MPVANHSSINIQYMHMIASVILLLCNSSMNKKYTSIDILGTLWPNVLFIFAPLAEIDPEEATHTLSHIS